MVVIGDNLTYQTGETIQINNTYSNDSGEYLLDSTVQVKTYDFSDYQDSSGFFTTHNFGYLLAVLSVVGMIGSFLSLKPEGFMQ